MTPTPATIEELEAIIATLYGRLAKGSDVLFARERGGQMGTTYDAWLAKWLLLLKDYEAGCALMETAQAMTPEQQALV